MAMSLGSVDRSITARRAEAAAGARPSGGPSAAPAS